MRITPLAAVAGLLLTVPCEAQVRAPAGAQPAAQPAGSVRMARDAAAAPATTPPVLGAAPAVLTLSQIAALAASLGMAPGPEQPFSLDLDHLRQPGRGFLTFANPYLVVPGSPGQSIVRFSSQAYEASSGGGTDRAVVVTLTPSAAGVTYLVDCRVSGGWTYRLRAGSTHVTLTNTQHVSVAVQANSTADQRITISGHSPVDSQKWEFHGCEVVPLVVPGS